MWSGGSLGGSTDVGGDGMTGVNFNPSSGNPLVALASGDDAPALAPPRGRRPVQRVKH